MAAGIWDRSESAMQAVRLYVAARGRLPDAGSLGFWVAQLDPGTACAAVNLGFAESPERQARAAGDTGGETPGTYGIRLA